MNDIFIGLIILYVMGFGTFVLLGTFELITWNDASNTLPDAQDGTRRGARLILFSWAWPIAVMFFIVKMFIKMPKALRTLIKKADLKNMKLLT